MQSGPPQEHAKLQVVWSRVIWSNRIAQGVCVGNFWVVLGDFSWIYPILDRHWAEWLALSQVRVVQFSFCKKHLKAMDLLLNYLSFPRPIAQWIGVVLHPIGIFWPSNTCAVWVDPAVPQLSPVPGDSATMRRRQCLPVAVGSTLAPNPTVWQLYTN